MTYSQLNTYLQTILVDQTPSADYTTILPAAIQYAEDRIYREMNFLATRTVNPGSAFTPGSRTFTLPTSPSTILYLEGVAAITPAGVAPNLGTRNALEPVSLDFIDFTWPTESETDLPDAWAMRDNATIVVKPTPDQNYSVELTGIFQPMAMSADNETTYIGNIYPDLLVAACMVFLTGYQRDFGAQSDNPQMALSWSAEYDKLFKSAYEEEQRRKGASVGWSPFQATPLANPPRT